MHSKKYFYGVYFKPEKDVYYVEKSSDNNPRNIIHILTLSYLHVYSKSKGSVINKLSKSKHIPELIASFSLFLFEYIHDKRILDVLHKNNYPPVLFYAYFEKCKKQSTFNLFNLVDRFTEMDSHFFPQNLTYFRFGVGHDERGPYFVSDSSGPYMLKGFLPWFAYLIMLRDLLPCLESDFKKLRLFGCYFFALNGLLVADGVNCKSEEEKSYILLRAKNSTKELAVKRGDKEMEEDIEKMPDKFSML